MKIGLHTLTTSGVIAEPSLLISGIFQYFLRSSAKQSTLYPNGVSSYRYLYFIHKDDKDRLCEEIEASLTILYGRYFIDVEVLASTNMITEELYNITISGNVTDSQNAKHTINEVIALDN